MDCSPPGSPVLGILQARTMEWVAISFSTYWQTILDFSSYLWKNVLLLGINSLCLNSPYPVQECGLGCVHGNCRNGLQFVELKGGLQCTAKRIVGMMNKCPIQMPAETQRSTSPKMHPGKTKTLERFDSNTPISHFARYLMEAALCFSIGDHAGINCQTCLTPPRHLIITCNTPECWQSWAIDSWHSLKLLIIFSQSPFQTCQLLCIVYEGEKSSILRFQDYALRGKLAVTLLSALECLCIHTQTTDKGFGLWNTAAGWQFWRQLAIRISKLIRQNEIRPWAICHRSWFNLFPL